MCIQMCISLAQGSWSCSRTFCSKSRESWNKIPYSSDKKLLYHCLTNAFWLNLACSDPIRIVKTSNTPDSLFSNQYVKGWDAGSRTSNVLGPDWSLSEQMSHASCSERMESYDEPTSNIQSFLFLSTTQSEAKCRRVKWLLMALGPQLWSFPGYKKTCWGVIILDTPVIVGVAVK